MKEEVIKEMCREKKKKLRGTKKKVEEGDTVKEEKDN